MNVVGCVPKPDLKLDDIEQNFPISVLFTDDNSPT
jgi:hypothetical protein